MPGPYKIKVNAYRVRAIESYQPMVDALLLVRPLAVRACDDQAIAAIDKALAAAGRSAEGAAVDVAGQSVGRTE